MCYNIFAPADEPAGYIAQIDLRGKTEEQIDDHGCRVPWDDWDDSLAIDNMVVKCRQAGSRPGSDRSDVKNAAYRPIGYCKRRVSLSMAA